MKTGDLVLKKTASFVFILSPLQTLWHKAYTCSMSDFIKMDIFFVVHTLVTLVLGVLGGIVLFYLVRIMRDVADIVRIVRGEAGAVMRDVEKVRTHVAGTVEDAHDMVHRWATLVHHYTHALSGVTIKRFFVSLITDLVSRTQEAPKTKKRASRKKHAEETVVREGGEV